MILSVRELVCCWNLCSNVHVCVWFVCVCVFDMSCRAVPYCAVHVCICAQLYSHTALAQFVSWRHEIYDSFEMLILFIIPILILILILIVVFIFLVVDAPCKTSHRNMNRTFFARCERQRLCVCVYVFTYWNFNSKWSSFLCLCSQKEIGVLCEATNVC